MRDDIETLIGCENINDFVPAYVDALRARDGDDLALWREASAALLPYFYKPKYPQFVHHAWMGLIVARCWMEQLSPPLRTRVTGQLIWYALSEERRPPFELPEGPAELVGNPETWMRRKQFASLLKYAQSGDDPRPLLEEMMAPAAKNLYNIGHSFIYLATTRQLLEYEREPLDRLLYPALHYLAHCPLDDGIWERAKRHTGYKSNEPAGLAPSLDTLIALEELIYGGNAGRLFENLGAGITYGMNRREMAGVLHAIAARVTFALAPADWVHALHVYHYSALVYEHIHHLTWEEATTLLTMQAGIIWDLCDQHRHIQPPEAIESPQNEVPFDITTFRQLLQTKDREGIKRGMARWMAMPIGEVELALQSEVDSIVHFIHDYKFLLHVYRMEQSKDPWRGWHRLAWRGFALIINRPKRFARKFDELWLGEAPDGEHAGP